MIARPLPTDVALRQIRKEKTDAVADKAQKARVGQVADLSDAQEYEDLLGRERSVVAGPHRRGVRRPAHRHRTQPGALEAARTRSAGPPAQAACEVRPLYGRQAQGFLCAALPLARSALLMRWSPARTQPIRWGIPSVPIRDGG